MKWNPEQELLLKDLAKFVRDPSRFIYRLWGKAGTGKTTLAAVIRDQFDELNWIALAYTGKAASRLRHKGWDNAGTIHSHLYVPGSKCRARIKEMEERRAILQHLIEGHEQPASAEEREQWYTEDEDLAKKIAIEEEALKNPVFVLNSETDLPDYNIIVVDEVSMVGTKEGSDLQNVCKNNRIKLILMGDPYQLPPVKQQAFFMGPKPDFELTQVMRQQENDPILHLAELARTRQRIPLGSYGSSKVVQRINMGDARGSFHPDQLAEMVEADQVLVGRNETRLFVNGDMRQMRGYEDELEIGEKLICLANSKQGFFNGSIWYCQDIFDEDDRGRITVMLSSDDSTQEDRICKIWKRGLRGEEIHFTERSGAEVMVTAQAVTVHKFQGSEGKHIVVLDESYTAREDAHRWMYTALTRAQERVTLMVK